MPIYKGRFLLRRDEENSYEISSNDCSWGLCDAALIQGMMPRNKCDTYENSVRCLALSLSFFFFLFFFFFFFKKKNPPILFEF